MSAYENKQKRLQAEAEALARKQLRNGEKLLFSSKEGSSVTAGIILMIIVAAILQFVASMVFRGGFRGYAFIFLIAFVMISLILRYVSAVRKNHCFVTDKRLYICEVNMFGLEKIQDIPISEIKDTAITNYSPDNKNGKTSINYYVYTKDNRIIEIKSSDRGLLLKTINSLIK